MREFWCIRREDAMSVVEMPEGAQEAYMGALDHQKKVA